MISYSPLWDTLKKKNESWYSLEKKYKVSAATLSRLKNNQGVTTKTINDLCKILHCDVSEIMRYEEDR
jgi:DNA-binding Xre family transcriptional regulator